MNSKYIKNPQLISLFISNILIAGLGFISGLVLAKYSTLEVRGEVGKILIWAAFTTGIVFTGTIEFFLSKEKDSSFNISRKQSISLCFIGILFSSIAFIYLKIPEYIYYLLLFIPINFYTSYKIAELNLSGDFLGISILKSLQPISYVAGLGLLLAIDELTVFSVILVNVISNIILFFVIKKRYSEITLLNNNKINFNKEWALVNFSTFIGLIATQFDKLYVTYAYSLEDISIYLVGLTLVSAPLGILCQTMATKILFTVKNSSKDIKKELIVYLVLSALFSIIIYFITPFILKFILEGKYDLIESILIPLIILVFLINFRIVLLRIMRGLGENSKVVKLEINFIFLLCAMLLLIVFVLELQLKDFILLYIVVFIINILFIGFLTKKNHYRSL